MKKFNINVKENNKYILCYFYDDIINISGYCYQDIALREYYYFRDKGCLCSINTITNKISVDRIISSFVERL